MNTTPEPSTETVYATRTGRAFHATPNCRALLGAQLMNDGHKVFWLARNRHRVLHRVEPIRMVAAFGQGKDPCTVCYPELRAAIWRSNSEHDFGHEPFEYDGVPICARCRTKRMYVYGRDFDGGAYSDGIPSRLAVWDQPVPWPCTSAIVLGLAPRPAPAA